MAKNKYYAVAVGKTTGIFESWEACKESVEGVSNAKYKGFTTLEEAYAYLGSADSSKEERSKTEFLIAYVDGSFDEGSGRYAYGCVFLLPDGTEVKKSGFGNQPDSAALRNVSGEMLGAMHAVKWAKAHHFNRLQICYDYSGIEMWATGKWKTNQILTKKYADYMKENAKQLEITFQKIAAHTGQKYNEEADRLAKRAILGEVEEG